MRRRAIILTVCLLCGYFTVLAQAPTANFTASATEGCTPTVINFQDQSTGNPTKWFWDFGNGGTSTLQNPSTTYFTPGTYTVKLTATNAAGSNTLTRTSYITVYAKPTVNFSVSDSIGCFPVRSQFTDQSTSAPGTTNNSWLWDFGNGVQDSTQNPLMVFTTAGAYTITLKVTSDKGCSSILSKTSYINVSNGVSASFTNTAPAICKPPYNITFNSQSQGPGTLTYYWDFGDGNSSTVQNPAHTYTTNGDYSVSLAVTSSFGCSDTIIKKDLLQIQDIKTDFSSPAVICVGVPATFTNTSTPHAQSTTWIFGNGATSTDSVGVTTFTTANNYTVTIVNNYGYCIDSASKTIGITPKPKAQFTSSSPIRCQPSLTVNFTDQSTNAVSWLWDFGDSSTSTSQNPSHTYANYGYYTVKLIAINSSGCSDTLVKDSLVRIVRPVLQFTGLPLQGCVPYAANFGASVTTLDAVTAYNWDFGDGSPVQTTGGNSVSHTYSTQGTYTVTLLTTTSTGCTDTLSLPGAVIVGTLPKVGFTASPNPVCARKDVHFIDTSSGTPLNIISWKWNFGDGATSTVQNPIHQYSDSGSFTVKLIVSNNGCMDSLIQPKYIRVKPPVAKFGFKANCSNQLQFNFIDSSIVSPSLPVTYLWNFGDGTTDSKQSPSHTFPKFGAYNVLLTVSQGGCTDSTLKTINVFNDNPVFAAADTNLCRIGIANFTLSNYSVFDIAVYNWDFGNGTSSVVTNGQQTYTGAVHNYPLNGIYSVTLTTTDIYGCTHTFSRPNYIHINGPTAKFTAVDTSGCKGLTTTFNDQSTSDGHNNLVSWTWNFGDSTSKTFTSPPYQHTYINAGTYGVTLTVKDAAGCMDSISKGYLIHTTDPKASFTADTLWCPGHPVQFTNQSTGEQITSAWDFGDGNTSTAVNPSNTYTNVGSYTISLAVTDHYGCKSSLIAPDYIKVKKPIASFTINDTATSCPPLEAHFTNTSQYYVSSLWNLSGGISTVTNPIRYYTAVGTYPITLTVTSPGGCVDSAKGTVRVFDTAGTRISYNPLAGCKPLDVSLNAFTPGPVTFTWDFGDGVLLTDTITRLTHIYDFFGNFVPKVIMTDPTGCVLPITGIDTIKIIGTTAKFGLDRRLLCDSGLVAFTDSTTYNDSLVRYNWNFGDGTYSSLTSPTHYYTSPGFYTVSLDVHTIHNCSDTFTLNNIIKIVQSPLISIAGDTVICANDYLQHSGVFVRQDTSAVQWAWKFPNGNTSTDQVPVKQQYTLAGTFPVYATAINSSGCVDSAAQNIRVNPLPVINVPSTISIQSGFPITIPASYSSNVTSYLWTPATGLSCTDCPQPVASPQFNTKYIIAVTDSNNCHNQAAMQVITFCKNANVFLPNTFSPNGDGNNDVFYVRGRGLERVKSLRIYNRWGQMVFESTDFPVNDPASGWNGKFNGNKPVPGVYVYQVDVYCENGDVIHFDGNVALIL